LPFSSALFVAALATAVGISGAVLGIWLTGMRRRARVVIPFSSGVLIGVALFDLLPDLAAQSGWLRALPLFAAGYGLLILLNRYGYSVCPSCAHDHDHAACTMELHGFAAPLISAAALHSFLDGWGVVTVSGGSFPLSLRIAVPLAVALHKLPEGIALGGILRAAVKRRAGALAWCVAAEGATFLGGVLALAMAPRLGEEWTIYPLGLTAGWLFYLGFHAVHEEWKRCGFSIALWPAAAGAAGAAALQRGVEMLFR
jgi:zinc transporter ZupT